MSTYNPFQKAVPVWARGRAEEMNVTCRFTAAVEKTDKPVLLRMTGSAVYRMYVNGVLSAYGPARGPKGYYRVDELPMNAFLTQDENIVLFEVAGYNINNFYLPDQPAFFQAEILVGNAITAWTAVEGGMPCDVVTERVQKVEKYSFQRAFTEAWKLGKAYADSFAKMTAGRTPLENCGEKRYIPRRVPFATLAKLDAKALIGAGKVKVEDKPVMTWQPRQLTGIDQIKQKGYPMDELEITLSQDACHYAFTPANQAQVPIDGALTVGAGEYKTVRFAQNLTGFVGAKMHADKPATVLFTFDELYENGDTNIFHMGVANIVRVDLKPGDYDFLSMEPYTMQYLKLIVFDGDVTFTDIRLAEYAAPADNFCAYETDNPAFRKIWDAAVQTYRQNAVDLFTDCPSRERAGWLCDSYWTSRTEYALTGKSVVEKNFLENFLLPDSFEFIPDGMIPMCYPSDHNDHVYIPNWAMWLIMELREYLDRSGDREMVDAFKDRIYKLLAFFEKFRNADGLLEKLESWVFVEWSRANQLVQDVNFPSNMLYAACLNAVGEMYGDDALIEEAKKIHETIRRLSYNGKFFTDHMIRGTDGTLTNDGEATEVCQYYAFYCGTAAPADYPELWKTLIRDFGPDRKKDNKYPEVAFANAFIGNYLRLDMLARNGSLDAVLDNVGGYFLGMAETTGTLWENDSTCASVNHGFASHVIVWLKAAAEAEKN